MPAFQVQILVKQFMKLCANWPTCSKEIDGSLTVDAQTPRGLRVLDADAASTKHI